MDTALVLITHNRLSYTIKCIERVLDDDKSDFDLYIWDNASKDDTAKYLLSLKDPRIKDVILSPENVGQTEAMNKIWGKTSTRFVGKLDNDCLVTPGWIDSCTKAHTDIPNLGAIACWHYRIEDFNELIAKEKITTILGHKIFQHPWVCGSGFVMKRETYMEMGPWPEGSPDIGITDYFIEMAKKGFINGWYYPLIIQEHMDDPLSKHCGYHDDESLSKISAITFSLRNFKINTMEKKMKRREVVIDQLLYGSANVKSYLGLQGKVRRFIPKYDKYIFHLKNLFQ